MLKEEFLTQLTALSKKFLIMRYRYLLVVLQCLTWKEISFPASAQGIRPFMHVKTILRWEVLKEEIVLLAREGGRIVMADRASYLSTVFLVKNLTPRHLKVIVTSPMMDLISLLIH